MDENDKKAKLEHMEMEDTDLVTIENDMTERGEILEALRADNSRFTMATKVDNRDGKM